MPATAEVPLRCIPRMATRVTGSGAAGPAWLERLLGTAEPSRGRLAEARGELLELGEVKLGEVDPDVLGDRRRVLLGGIDLAAEARRDVLLGGRHSQEPVEPQQQVARILPNLVEKADKNLVAAEDALPVLVGPQVIGAQHVRLPLEVAQQLLVGDLLGRASPAAREAADGRRPAPLDRVAQQVDDPEIRVDLADLLDELRFQDRIGGRDLAGDLTRPRPENARIPAVSPRGDEEADVPGQLGEEPSFAPPVAVCLAAQVATRSLSQMPPVERPAERPALDRVEVVDLLDGRQPDFGMLLEIGVKPGSARAWGPDSEEGWELFVASPCHRPPREHRSPGPRITCSVR